MSVKPSCVPLLTDDDKELLPPWLRFVKGIIDSSDLPLNVSREILQQNRVMAKIKSNSVKKILDRLKTIAGNKEKYANVLKSLAVSKTRKES